VYNVWMRDFQPTERLSDFRDILSRFQSGFPSIIDCEEGWNTLIADCHLELKSIDNEYTIAQIKEKFGTLRYYFASSNPSLYKEMCNIVSKYEQKSASICEVCGKSGKTRNSVTVKTLCDEHAPKS